VSPYLRLLPIDAPLAEALRQEGGERFEKAYGASVHDAAFVRGVAEHTFSLHMAPPWSGYLAADGRAVIGTCAFKGPPDAEGAVEIAYFTFPPYEGRGYATAMAQALLEIALESPEVRLLRAHTLPEPNASTRVLEKLGLRHLGAVEDPEDGTVWRWELAPEGR
jgi:[ribosomal protein S5]-alanine N-acetyltransferase